ALLRLARRQDHHVWARPYGGHRAHAADARDDGDRGHQDVDSAPPEGAGRQGFRGGQVRHALHGTLHAGEEARWQARRIRLKTGEASTSRPSIRSSTSTLPETASSIPFECSTPG